MEFITEVKFMGRYNREIIDALMNEDENDNKMDNWNIVNSRCLMSKIKRNGNIVKVNIKEKGYKDHYEVITVEIIEGEKLGVIDRVELSFAEMLGEGRAYMYRNGINMWWRPKGIGQGTNYLIDEEYETIAYNIMNYVFMYA